ncbi:TssQ family T6SS-associated lipoprotein [Niveibacterium sp. SC-1]|uniref:TssQ family T6SS-associated lipoprotein n=1 Tax=Niveibacterium sp. SC-1 TaxID=3135646 RepID=UPI00311E313F
MPSTLPLAGTSTAIIRCLAFACALCLTACQGTGNNLASGATPARSNEQIASDALAKARQMYDEGNFDGVISTLKSSNEIPQASPRVQVQAHKLLAFVYGATGKASQCYLEFAKALDIDPGFQLSPAEKSHPTWGRMYELARKRPAA